MTHAMFMEFMTFFSVLNIPGSFLGGFVVNWLTCRHSAILFAILGVVGQGLSTLGAYVGQVSLLFIGRMLFGLSVEVINICVFAQIVYWFNGRLYNFAYATTVAMARLGMVVIMMIGPIVTDTIDMHNMDLRNNTS